MSLQDGFEEGGGAAGGVVGDLFGGALGDEVAAFGAGFGADIDEVVGFGEDVGVVLDDDDGVAFVHEAVGDVDEAFHVGHVEADGGFFDEVEVALGVTQPMSARLLGISEKTLQNWEQGRRKPTEPAKVLLKVADRHPKLLLETVR